MNPKLVEKLSLWQLAILIFIFEVGSVAVVGVGQEAKQDAWIAIALATGIGIGLIAFYMFLLSKLPGKNLFEILVFCLGKWVGKFIGALYVLYFFYIASRVLRDFCELIITVIFKRTPIETIAITMMLVIVYMLYLGLEVLGRTSEVFIPYVFSFIIFIGLGTLFSGEMEFKNLQPILADGIGPIAKAIFPQLLTFPFGEMIAFMMIIPYLTKFKKAGKVSIAAVAISGLMIIYASVIQITTLGLNMWERSSFPLLSAAREISLLAFIERVDLIIVFIVMYGIIVKVSVFFYGGLKGIEVIINKPYRTLVFPLGMVISYFSIQISDTFAEHIEEGIMVIPMFLHLPFQLFIPALITPILIWKVKKQQRRTDNESV
ncbi:GerAB/ArcD/ProY family transporter [Bacillus dakarensis]|uniref:GerAB/ArcD/ProY family transporter n=1 Tax=Robertmurraya dakarensis TaxID=1926278 RepID=UPI000981A07B|nr:endospore germination permease [Bacillus dakarensis]